MALQEHSIDQEVTAILLSVTNPHHRHWRKSAVDPEEGEMFEFEAFASTHFQGGESHRCVTRLLRRPLLEHDNVNDQKSALVIWVAILRFMRDAPEPQIDKENIQPEITKQTVKAEKGKSFKKKVESAWQISWEKIPSLDTLDSPTTNIEKIHFICSYGINRPHLRDEIYCQLCKQLTGNQSSTSRSRGWILMALCLGCFPPSPTYLNFLQSFLKSGPPSYSEYCCKKLQRTRTKGTRFQPPSTIEMTSAKSAVDVPVEVTLMDGSKYHLEVDSAVTCKEMCLEIKDKVGLEDEFGFSIWIASLEQIANWGAGEESVLDAVSIGEQFARYKGLPQSAAPGVSKLFFRKDIFTPGYDPTLYPVANNLIYHQIIGGLQCEEYILLQPDEYAEVLSRLYYVSNGKDLDEDKLKGLVTKFIPNTLLYEQSDEELVQLAKEKFGESVNIANHADPEIVKGEVVLYAMQKFSADFSRHYECYLVSGPSKANCLLMMYIDNQGVRLELEHAKYVPVIIQYGNIVSITLAPAKHDQVTELVLSVMHPKKGAFVFRSRHVNAIRVLISSQWKSFHNQFDSVP